MFDAAITFAEGVPPLSFLLGIALLLGGGHWLVEGSVTLARRLGMSTLLIGLTVVACGTSAPELFFNVAASMSGQGDLSFGNVVGSNIANLGLVLGVAAFVAPLAVHRSVVRRELPLLLIVSLGLVVLAFVGIAPEIEGVASAGGFTRPEGFILLAAFVAMLAFWTWTALRGDGEVPHGDDPPADDEDPGALGPAIAMFVFGLLGLLAGGKLAEIGAVGIAESANLSPTLIGLTIVAVATSLPEVVTLLVALRKGHADLAVGNVVGSNLFNILFVLGATAVFGDVGVPAGRGWIDLTVMMGMTILLMALATSNERRVLRWQSGILLFAWTAYMAGSVIAEVLGRGDAA